MSDFSTKIDTSREAVANLAFKVMASLPSREQRADAASFSAIIDGLVVMDIAETLVELRRERDAERELLAVSMARIEKLESALRWMIDNDDTNEGDEPIPRLGGESWNSINAYWIAGLNAAREALSDKGESNDQSA